MQVEPEQSEDGSEEGSGSNNSTSRESHGERQELKLGLLVGFASVIPLVLLLAKTSPEVRVWILLFSAVAGAVLLLIAKYIVYSYNREKSQSRGPYHRDHIIK